jgi:UDP-N-acetylglucosamine acyltransferase
MNHIHPSAVIGPSVSLGQGNVIGPHVVLAGKTTLGDNNWIGPGTCIGIAGDLLGRPTTAGPAFWIMDDSQSYEVVTVGSRNTIKENVTIHAGSHRPTVIGNDCYLMPRSHLGHDCWIGDHVLLSPNAQIAGHVAIGSRSVIGMGALVHQFSSIGPVSMIGMGCCVRGSVEPCRTAVGEPHRVSGINKVGLQRFLGDELANQAVTALKNRDLASMPPALLEAINRWRDNIDFQD